MILAGDVGGTKCTLALFQPEGAVLRCVFRCRFAVRDYSGFEVLLDDFVQQAASALQPRTADDLILDAAGFGVAGAVIEGRHFSENLPWLVDVSALKRKLNLKNICLLNDLMATALSLERLTAVDLVALNPGTPMRHATRGVIAAGTGLGTSLLFWDGGKYQVAPSEAGQADFAPRTERELHLLRHLRRHFQHVSCEEVISGRSFRHIHEFLDPAAVHPSFGTSSGASSGASSEPGASNPAAEIVERGLAKSCAVCVETLDFWTEMFGGVTGNFALQTMALGGIYIAGGIPAKILAKLQEGAFFKSFCGVGKLQPVLARVPIFVVVNEDAPVWGAAYQAFATVTDGL
jgi:glucokinase